jgi:predicted nucleic acid-binding protein
MNAVDTNVLLYVQDPRDPGKQAIAAALVSSMVDGVLMWQVACEFLAASKKLAATGFTRDQARQYIRDLRNLWQPFCQIGACWIEPSNCNSNSVCPTGIQF